jgi:F-type H+-transporting ATPase subunit epsilon|tara:strand:+ start:2557 stop:2817 length:261 start_codon:yes stop_codon:yes gene_type:complete
MANNLNVNIVSPLGEILSGEAKSVIAPGSLGQMTILPKHASLLSSLSKGKIIVNLENEESSEFEIDGGFLEISNDILTIIVEKLSK